MDNQTKEEERLLFLIACSEIFQTTMSADGTTIAFDGSLKEMCDAINSYHWSFIAMIKEEKSFVSGGGDSVPTRANIFKIISATEFSIIRIQPILGDRQINAKFAFFVSRCLYSFYLNQEYPSIKNFNAYGEKIWEKFTEDRVSWLTNIDETNFPFFLNSQVWMLIGILTHGQKAL
jgi:hypothetical protein